MEPKPVHSIQVRVDLGVMEMDGYTTFPKRPYQLMQFSVIPRTLVGGGVLPSYSLRIYRPISESVNLRSMNLATKQENI